MVMSVDNIPVSRATGRAEVPLRRWVLVVLSLAALISLCLEYGFAEPLLPVWQLVSVQLLAIAAYLADVITSLAKATDRLAEGKRRWPDVLLILLALALLASEVGLAHKMLLKVSTAYVATLQILLVVRIAAAVIRWNIEMSQRRLHPARLLVLSFLLVIVIGGLLLALPRATTATSPQPDSVGERLVQSFFTSTSATCVTGLIVCDTGRDYTRFGQIIILCLIQLGGLGIMISSTLFALLMGKQLSLRQSLVLQDATSSQTIGRMGAVVRFIVITTVVCEAAGAVVCYPMFASVCDSTGDSVFCSVFHAVSAFCNAGFALQTDSLSGFGHSLGLYCAIMPLIVVGGLGFPVLQDLLGWVPAQVGDARLSIQSDLCEQPHVRRLCSLSIETSLQACAFQYTASDRCPLGPFLLF